MRHLPTVQNTGQGYRFSYNIQIVDAQGSNVMDSSIPPLTKYVLQDVSDVNQSAAVFHTQNLKSTVTHIDTMERLLCCSDLRDPKDAWGWITSKYSIQKREVKRTSSCSSVLAPQLLKTLLQNTQN